jgi:hypothetical protein
VTEQEWLSHWQSFANIKKMANEIGSVVSKRKLRLLACACCRRSWGSLAPATRELLLLAEKHADRKANPKILPLNQRALRQADWLSRAVHKAAFRHDNPEILIEAVRNARSAKASRLPKGRYGEVLALERDAQLELVRDIFGPLPFGSVAFKATWRTSNVRALARGIYADRAFDRLPILADALEDAGCDNADILNHCRGGGEHVRGCWVVDLVLGKV